VDEISHASAHQVGCVCADKMRRLSKAVSTEIPVCRGAAARLAGPRSYLGLKGERASLARAMIAAECCLTIGTDGASPIVLTSTEQAARRR
jgi:hypothetical protein